MSWNYRLVRIKDDYETPYYELKEVFYNRDGTLVGYCDATVSGECITDIIKVLDTMKNDAHMAVIDESEFFRKPEYDKDAE